MKVTMNIPDDLLVQIDTHAKSLGINRTAYIVMSMSQKVQADTMLNSMPDIQRVLGDLQKAVQTTTGLDGQAIDLGSLECEGEG